MKRRHLPVASARHHAVRLDDRVGRPYELARQMRTLAPVLPLILVLAAIGFLFQGAGWRLGMPADWLCRESVGSTGGRVEYVTGPSDHYPVVATIAR